MSPLAVGCHRVFSQKIEMPPPALVSIAVSEENIIETVSCK